MTLAAAVAPLLITAVRISNGLHRRTVNGHADLLLSTDVAGGDSLRTQVANHPSAREGKLAIPFSPQLAMHACRIMMNRCT